MFVRAGIHRMFVRIANREDPDQTASDLGLSCLSRFFLLASSVRNFRTFTVGVVDINPSFLKLKTMSNFINTVQCI